VNEELHVVLCAGRYYVFIPSMRSTTTKKQQASKQQQQQIKGEESFAAAQLNALFLSSSHQCFEAHAPV
jgi:hypothetical protein